jgi:hypothetical protein
VGPARRPVASGAAPGAGGERGQAAEGRRAVRLRRGQGAGAVLRRLPALRRRLPARVRTSSPLLLSPSVSAHSPLGSARLTPRATRELNQLIATFGPIRPGTLNLRAQLPIAPFSLPSILTSSIVYCLHFEAFKCV